MSITALSNVDEKGKPLPQVWWMAPFWNWFALSIKLINPACLWFIFCNNLYNDFTSPYADQELRMHLFAMIYVIIALIIIIVPMFICSYPESFRHDVNREFAADEIYEKALLKRKRAEFALRQQEMAASAKEQELAATK